MTTLQSTVEVADYSQIHSFERSFDFCFFALSAVVRLLARKSWSVHEWLCQAGTLEIGEHLQLMQTCHLEIFISGLCVSLVHVKSSSAIDQNTGGNSRSNNLTHSSQSSPLCDRSGNVLIFGFIEQRADATGAASGDSPSKQITETSTSSEPTVVIHHLTSLGRRVLWNCGRECGNDKNVQSACEEHIHTYSSQ
jgi:hypothetical protein